MVTLFVYLPPRVARVFEKAKRVITRGTADGGDVHTYFSCRCDPPNQAHSSRPTMVWQQHDEDAGCVCSTTVVQAFLEADSANTRASPSPLSLISLPLHARLGSYRFPNRSHFAYPNGFWPSCTTTEWLSGRASRSSACVPCTQASCAPCSPTPKQPFTRRPAKRPKTNRDRQRGQQQRRQRRRRMRHQWRCCGRSPWCGAELSRPMTTGSRSFPFWCVKRGSEAPGLEYQVQGEGGKVWHIFFYFFVLGCVVDSSYCWSSHCSRNCVFNHPSAVVSRVSFMPLLMSPPAAYMPTLLPTVDLMDVQ